MGRVEAGYKMTEVGVIPSDWDITTLGGAVEFLDEQRKPIKSADRESIRGVYPYYGASGIIDYVNGYLFDDELILLGEDGENILSRSVRLAFRVSGKIWVNNHAHVLKPKPDFEIGFLTEFLESIDYSVYNSGTAQPKLNKATCKRIPIIKPTLTEQRAIATALSDVDALIASLDRLIEKKKAIKQGAMQELLTGKTRLASFGDGVGYKMTEVGRVPEDWEVKEIAETFSFSGGSQPPRSTFVFHKKEGYIRLIQIRDYKSDKFKTYVPTSLAQKFCDTDDIMIGRYGPPIFQILRGLEGAYNVALIKAIPKESLFREFGYYVLTQEKVFNFVDKLSQRSSGQTGVDLQQLNQYLIQLPPTLTEQRAIAETLSDMDTEIQALETKRDKYQQIKQGMMQELLTGKTRLL